MLGFDEPDPKRPEYVKDHPGTRLIPPGEFVVGHDRVGGIPYDEMPEWTDNGSFQVVRRLAQDVPGWWAQVAAQLKVLRKAKVVPDEATAEWLAARMVGRWRSGTPVAKCPHADMPDNALAGQDNDFGYRNDPEGFTTPLFSHLRKTNPRDGLQEKPGTDPFPENPVMDRRRIIRRGAPTVRPSTRPRTARAAPTTRAGCSSSATSPTSSNSSSSSRRCGSTTSISRRTAPGSPAPTRWSAPPARSTSRAPTRRPS